MAKKSYKSTSKKSPVKDATSLVRIADIVAIVSSVWVMNSVAESFYFKLNSDSEGTLKSFALVASLLAILYSIYSKRRLSFTTSFCLGLLVASMFIWYFGLSA